MKLMNLLIFCLFIIALAMIRFNFRVSTHPDLHTRGLHQSSSLRPGGMKAMVRMDHLDNNSPRLKIAVAITVTKDGPYLDGAAVLMHSVRLVKSRHDIEFVAIIHAGVQSTRAGLVSLGFKLHEFTMPINSSEIQGKYLREEIDKSGCCGAGELLKLRAWQLTEYDRVIALDMDAVLVRNIDHLFEQASPEGSIMFTYDHAMNNPKSAFKPPVQGGFLLIKPAEHVYQELVQIVREGDFRPGTGWAGSRIGWCWGGQTIQGLISYYVALGMWVGREGWFCWRCSCVVV